MRRISRDWEELELELTHGSLEVFDGTAMAVKGHTIFLSAIDELMDKIDCVKIHLKERADKSRASVPFLPGFTPVVS